MILFCGIPSEPPLALAIEAATEAGLDHLVLNQRDGRFTDISLDWEEGRSSGRLWASDREWCLEEFEGVYTRLIDAEVLPENRPRGRTPANPADTQKSILLFRLLGEWMETASCRIVNKARAMSSNASKPYQAQQIARFGFLIPPTLVSNDPEVVRGFLQEYGRVIYKSISSVRSIVRELTPRLATNLDRIRSLPTQFQALVKGTNIRVHVVGDVLFATEIKTQALDYRYASRDGHEVEMQEVQLPNEVASRCRALSKGLELPFCGIDLIRAEDGLFYCLEVNPSPAYSYYQENSGQPIARALVEYLAGRQVTTMRSHASC